VSKDVEKDRQFMLRGSIACDCVSFTNFNTRHRNHISKVASMCNKVLCLIIRFNFLRSLWK